MSKPRYAFALVTRNGETITWPLYERRAEAKEARRWREDADNLRIKRVRITICTNGKGQP